MLRYVKINWRSRKDNEQDKSKLTAQAEFLTGVFFLSSGQSLDRYRLSIPFININSYDMFNTNIIQTQIVEGPQTLETWCHGELYTK